MPSFPQEMFMDLSSVHTWLKTRGGFHGPSAPTELLQRLEHWCNTYEAQQSPKGQDTKDAKLQREQ